MQRVRYAIWTAVVGSITRMWCDILPCDVHELQGGETSYYDIIMTVCITSAISLCESESESEIPYPSFLTSCLLFLVPLPLSHHITPTTRDEWS